MNLKIDQYKIDHKNKEGGRRMNKNEQSLGEMWDQHMQTNICVMIVPEGEEREKDKKNIQRSNG